MYKDFRFPAWEIAVHLAVAGDVFDGVFLWCPFSREMFWMRSGTLLSKLLRVFLPTLDSTASTPERVWWQLMS